MGMWLDFIVFGMWLFRVVKDMLVVGWWWSLLLMVVGLWLSLV